MIFSGWHSRQPVWLCCIIERRVSSLDCGIGTKYFSMPCKGNRSSGRSKGFIVRFKVIDVWTQCDLYVISSVSTLEVWYFLVIYCTFTMYCSDYEVHSFRNLASTRGTTGVCFQFREIFVYDTINLVLLTSLATGRRQS